MAIIAIPVVILFAMFGGFYNDTAEFRAEVDKDKAEHTSCEWKYVGKKEKMAAIKAAAGLGGEEKREVSKRKAAHFSLDKVQEEASGNLKRTTAIIVVAAADCLIAKLLVTTTDNLVDS